MKNTYKWKSKLLKGLGLPPKKRSFSVKRLTIISCALGIGKRINDSFVTSSKIEFF